MYYHSNQMGYSSDNEWDNEKEVKHHNNLELSITSEMSNSEEVSVKFSITVYILVGTKKIFSCR